MTDFEVHELGTRAHHFNVSVSKNETEIRDNWSVSFAVHTRDKEGGVYIEEIQCTSGLMTGSLSALPLEALLKLVDYLKEIGWKL